MEWGDIVGYLFIGAVLALIAWSLIRMEPRWPYLLTAGVLLAVEGAMRILSYFFFPRASAAGLMYMENPAADHGEDLVWPNRILVFLLVALAIWLVVRPQRNTMSVGMGLALVTAGAWPNLLEPLMRGATTDYIAVGPLVLNLADLCLVFGLPLLLAGVVIGEVRRVRGGDA